MDEYQKDLLYGFDPELREAGEAIERRDNEIARYRGLARRLADDAIELKKLIYDRKGIGPLTTKEVLRVHELNKHLAEARAAGIDVTQDGAG